MAHDSCSTSGCSCCSCDHDHDHTEDSGVLLKRVIVALVIFFAVEIASVTGLLESWFGENTLYAEFVLFLIPFLIAGYDVVIGAFKSLLKGHALDENFLMTVAS
jgi:Cd2+/Zn2+-exporting ATPase